ncbi:hypothetical protein BN133_3748 [Cronobacter dublinensis 582]|nr:hypothetical protein BN133_3748 [Cronobacter dublinensis 582]
MVVEATGCKARERVAAENDALKPADALALKDGKFASSQSVTHALRKLCCLIHYQPANVNGKFDISK